MSIHGLFVKFDKIADKVVEQEEKEQDSSSEDKKQEIFNKTIEFIRDKEVLSDTELHNWAESEGFDVSEVEELMYFLAYNFVHILFAGKSYEAGISEDDVDPDELKQGVKVEMEHTDDANIAKKIALDHLTELSDYYSRLKKMEGDK
jgi:hypothetical protein